MTKRFLLFLLVICLSVTLCACGESSTIVSLDDSDNTVSETVDLSASTLSVFTTRDDREYLEFLTTFDNQSYDIVDISTGMSTYACGESYVVTYTKKTETSTAKAISYKYYLYKTREQSEYLKFYSSFDFDTYEIVDISTMLSTYASFESYVITYREPN